MVEVLVAELEQPGKAVDFLLEFSDEKYQQLVDIGFNFYTEIDAKAIADGASIIKSDLFHIAGKINSIKAMKVFINRGHNVNVLDKRGYNVLSCALDSLMRNTSIVYILLQNSTIQINNYLDNIFENEDMCILCTILLEFSYKNNDLMNLIKCRDSIRLKQLLSNYIDTGDIAYDVVRMHLNDQYPNLDQILENSTSEVSQIENYINNSNLQLSNIDFENFERSKIIEISKKIIEIIVQLNNFLINFSKTYVDAKDFIRRTNDFLDSALISLQKSRKIVEGNKEEFNALLEDPRTDPFALLGPVELFRGSLEEGLRNIDKLTAEVDEKKQSFNREFEGISINEYVLKKIQTRLKETAKLFCEPNGLYSKFIFIRTGFEKLYNKIRFEESAKMFIAKATNTKYIPPIPEIETINTQFSKESARIRTAWMQCITPISQPRINYVSNEDEMFYDCIEDQAQEIIVNFNRSNEIENSLKEMAQNPHICCKCHKYVAVYVCQCCWNLVSCAECGPIECPQCKVPINGLRYLIKTSYPGKEFREHHELLHPPKNLAK